MIRPFTCICMVLAGASGLYLYQEKHRTQMLDREIAATVRAADAARERSGVLRAEWTLLNDPERLAQLADRFLTLKTVTPGQFTTMAELDRRLPPVRRPEQKPTDTDEGEPVAGVAEPEAAKVVEAPGAAEPAPAKPEPPPVRPEPPKIAAAPKPPPAKVATAAPAPRPAERPTERPTERLAERQAERPAERRAPAPGPRVTAVSETRTAIAPQPRPALSPAPFAPVSPAAAPAPVVTSVLGIARTNIAPPVPFSPQPSNNGGG